MKRSTYLMIDAVYIYAQLLGILNFCYNRRTGKAHISVYITIYSAIISLLMFAVLMYFLLNMEIKTRPPGSADLHYKLNLLTTIISVGGVFATIFYNWTKRENYVEIVNSYQKFCKKFLQRFRMEEKYVKSLECGIREKLKRSLVANLLMYIITMQNISEIFDMKNPYILFPLALIPTVLNVVMTLYYFAILNINSFMNIINDEIKRILNAAVPNCQPAIAMRLADELSLLSGAQFKLNKYLRCTNKMYCIQGVCVMLDFYVNNICVTYMFAMMSEQQELWVSYGKWFIYFIPIAFFVHYLDLKSFIFVVLNTLDLVEQTAELLKDRKIWMSKVNENLERNLNDYSLQLASIPLEFDLVGLFKVNRAMAFATLGSTISNAIVLIQCDLKYTKRQ